MCLGRRSREDELGIDGGRQLQRGPDSRRAQERDGEVDEPALLGENAKQPVWGGALLGRLDRLGHCAHGFSSFGFAAAGCFAGITLALSETP